MTPAYSSCLKPIPSEHEEMPPSNTVLVVEDDPDIREMVLTLLTLAGFVAVAAADGLQALAYLGAHALPAVILLDWHMPRCDGPEFRALQLQDPRLCSIPVILFSSEDRCPEKAVALGAAGWLPKPARPRQLLRAIAPYCNRQEGYEHHGRETSPLESSL